MGANDLAIVITARDTTGAAFKSSQGHVQALTKELFSLQNIMTGTAGIAAGIAARSFTETASSFERMEIQLDKITKGKGPAVLDELNQWAMEMPVNTEKAVDSFRLLMAMGLNPTMDMLQTLTDVSSIFSEETLSRLSLQLGQMAAKGKVMAQDLNIMAEAGINARGYLQEAFGMTVEELQGSGIEISRIITALFDGMKRDFGGSAKDMMKSWSGLTTVTKSYFVELKRNVMDAGLFDAMKGGLSDFNDELRSWITHNEDAIRQNVPEYIDQIKGSIDDAKGAIKGVISIYDALPDGITGAAGYGLLGRILWGASAGKFLAAASLINDGLENIPGLLPDSSNDMSVGSITTKWQEYLEVYDNIADVMTGRKDWNTGEEIAPSTPSDLLAGEIEAQQRLIGDLKEQQAKQQEGGWLLDLFEPGRAEKTGAWVKREEAHLEALRKRQAEAAAVPEQQAPTPVPPAKPASIVDAIAAEEAKTEAARIAQKARAKLQGEFDKEQAARLKKNTAWQIEEIEKRATAYKAGGVDAVAVTQWSEGLIGEIVEKNNQKTTKSYQTAFDDYMALVLAKGEAIREIAEEERQAAEDARQAEEDRLRNSRAWQDGATRGLADYASAATDAAANVENAFVGGFQSMEDALVRMATTGKMEVSTMVNSMVADLVRLSVRQSITGPLAAGLGQFIGSMGGSFAGTGTGSYTSADASFNSTYATYNHTGGIVGQTANRNGAFPSAMFDHAPRFHQGLMPDEFPAILQKGEAVIPRDAMRGARASGTVVNVNVKNSPHTPSVSAPRENADGSIDIDLIYEELEGRMASNVAEGRGSFAGVMESTYGADRTYGASR